MALVLAVAVMGCSDDGADGNDAGRQADAGGQSDASHDGGASTGLPSLAELSPGWNRIEPGGETKCARGDQFWFFVRPGTVNKLAIAFDGGGACWDASTCGLADAIFSPTADEEIDSQAGGVADFDNPENPFKDWTHVFIPYCTGDIHWGDNVATYMPDDGGEPIVIHHKGRVNGMAVLDWVYENVKTPETVLVTGFSAGSYGSIGYAPYLMEHYADADVYQLGDCGAGIVTDTFFEDSFPSWKAEGMIANWIPALNVPASELKLPDLYAAVGDHYPEQVVGQYNTHNDENQRFYYTAMGGKDEDWSPNMLASLDEIIARTPNFREYTAWGVKHVILPYPEFYTYQVDGVRLRNWIADFAAGTEIENVRCTDCETEELYTP